MDIQFRVKQVLTGLMLALVAAVPAIAEDIEIYTRANLGAATVQPNVMFLMDNSGSMRNELPVTVPYDHTVTYATSGGYDNTMYYYADGDAIPDSGSRSYFDKASNKCDNSLNEYDTGVPTGNPGSLVNNGYYIGQVAQHSTQRDIWQQISTRNAAERAYSIECIADSSVHGEAGAGNPYITDSAGGWTSTVPADPNDPHPVWSGGINNMTLYDGNFLNFLVDPAVGTTDMSKFDIVKNAVTEIVEAYSNIGIGLGVFDTSPNQGYYEGASVQYPILDVNASRNDFKSRLANLAADGSTPLSEAYFEMLLYFGGKEIVYGDKAVPSNQTGTKENSNPSHYETPISNVCQKNYIIVLSDGAPQLDWLSVDKRNLLPGFDTSSCNSDPYPGDGNLAYSYYNKDAYDSANSSIDNCLDEFAGWALTNDVAQRSFPAHDGFQNITTYTIGFDFDNTNPDLQAAEQLMNGTAAAGGTVAMQEASDSRSLVALFNKILADILAVNSTFSSPAVSVNAFNRATNLDDLYFSLFKPGQGSHWNGNLKKYKLATVLDVNGDPVPEVQDRLGNPAINPTTGFFTDSSVSFWTPGADAPDGAETAKGGAASKLGTTRNVYTFTGTYADDNGVSRPDNGVLNSGSNVLDKTNAAITAAMLGVTGLPEIVTGEPYRDTLLDWAFGLDVLGPSPTAPRRIIGDPLHAEPALVQYGESNGDPDLTAYMATNDGYLHAIDTITGDELWSFVPQEMLPLLNVNFEDTGAGGKSYGLDGNVVPWIKDVNFDGDLGDAGDHVYLYFGQRRGGSDIFSMDVSNRASPQLRWVIKGGTGAFAEMGESWSPPNVERLKLSGTTKNVLIFGGGYDTAQDTVSVRTPDIVGRSVYIVDADSGALLWRAGPDASADLQLTDMNYSIPGRIKPVDVDSNGYVDQLYFGDMGGQLWRIDIEESDTTSNLSTLISGGRIADLATDNSVANTRRFYYPPDVALIIENGQSPYLSIVAASGYRAHPLNQAIHDRMYMLRMDDIYSAPSVYTTMTEADLFDTTDNTIGEGSTAQKAAAVTSLSTADGWYITFNELDGSFIGEKALAEPLIIGGVGLVTTFVPEDLNPNANSCVPKEGTGSLYFVNVTDGTPTFNIAGTVDKTREDRKEYLKRGGIPPSPSVIITEGGTPTLCIGTECGSANMSLDLQKMYWYEIEQ